MAAVAEPTTWLGNWYGTVLFWRPQLALVVNERTLVPVLMPLAPAATVLDRFRGALAETLATAGVERRFIDAEVAEMREGRWATTSNRKVLGVMNEFSFLADQIRRDRDGSDGGCVVAGRDAVRSVVPAARQSRSGAQRRRCVVVGAPQRVATVASLVD